MRRTAAKLLAVTVLGTAGLAIGPTPSMAATPYIWANQSTGANMRACASSTACAIIGWLPNESAVEMLCWWDGDWANGNYWTNRWFKIRFSDGNALVHASLVTNQAAVRRCNTGYANDGL